jgi:hypothetical protein
LACGPGEEKLAGDLGEALRTGEERGRGREGTDRRGPVGSEGERGARGVSGLRKEVGRSMAHAEEREERGPRGKRGRAGPRGKSRPKRFGLLSFSLLFLFFSHT